MWYNSYVKLGKIKRAKGVLTLEIQEIIVRLEQFGYHVPEQEVNILVFLKGKTVYEIENICNINLNDELYDKALENLRYKAIDKICAEFLLMKLNAGVLNLDDIDMNKIGLKSVTEGDTSVTYATDGGQSREQILKAYLIGLSLLDQEELYKYRKMEW